MAHYAKVENGTVTKVIVAESAEAIVDQTPGRYIKTSYNTRGGEHLLGGTPLRKNYAGIGYTYDYEREAFIPPKPYASWTLNETTCLWEAPIEKPEGKYGWNEETQQWELAT